MWSALTTGGGCCILVADTPVKGGNAAGAEVDHLASQGLEHDVALAVAPGRPSRSATAWYYGGYISSGRSPRPRRRLRIGCI